jgi:hypothetical protein
MARKIKLHFAPLGSPVCGTPPRAGVALLLTTDRGKVTCARCNHDAFLSDESKRGRSNTAVMHSQRAGIATEE